jgi:hypothetical protein
MVKERFSLSSLSVEDTVMELKQDKCCGLMA